MSIGNFFPKTSPRIKKLLFIIKDEGIFVFLKQIYKHYAFLICLPFCFWTIKRVNFKNTEEMVDFLSKSYFGYLESLQVKSEIVAMLEYVKKSQPKIIMEIGTARGGTLFALARTAPENALIISLDLPRRMRDYPWWKLRLFKSFARDQQQIHLIRKDSHKEETVEEIKNILGNRKINFLFIDGDHSYDGVKKDFELYKPLVEKGGAIAFHDIASHPPEINCKADELWNKIKKDYKFEEYIENRKQGWGGIGLIKI